MTIGKIKARICTDKDARPPREFVHLVSASDDPIKWEIVPGEKPHSFVSVAPGEFKWTPFTHFANVTLQCLNSSEQRVGDKVSLDKLQELVVDVPEGTHSLEIRGTEASGRRWQRGEVRLVWLAVRTILHNKRDVSSAFGDLATTGRPTPEPAVGDSLEVRLGALLREELTTSDEQHRDIHNRLFGLAQDSRNQITQIGERLVALSTELSEWRESLTNVFKWQAKHFTNQATLQQGVERQLVSSTTALAALEGEIRGLRDSKSIVSTEVEAITIPGVALPVGESATGGRVEVGTNRRDTRETGRAIDRLFDVIESSDSGPGVSSEMVGPGVVTGVDQALGRLRPLLVRLSTDALTLLDGLSRRLSTNAPGLQLARQLAGAGDYAAAIEAATSFLLEPHDAPLNASNLESLVIGLIEAIWRDADGAVKASAHPIRVGIDAALGALGLELHVPRDHTTWDPKTQLVHERRDAPGRAKNEILQILAPGFMRSGAIVKKAAVIISER